jgi:hypothetical protein
MSNKDFKFMQLQTSYGINLSPEMLAKIEAIIEDSVNKKLKDILSELLDEKLETVVKKCLEEKGEKAKREVFEFKNVPLEEATSMVEKYIEDHSGCLTSDIVFDLKLDLDLVLKSLRELEHEKKVKGEALEQE